MLIKFVSENRSLFDSDDDHDDDDGLGRFRVAALKNTTEATGTAGEAADQKSK